MRLHVPPPLVWTVGLVLSCLLCLPFAAPAHGAHAIQRDAMPEDLRSLKIEDEYVPTGFPEVGIIHALEGNMVVVHRSNREAFLGRQGDTIHENDEVYTLPGARCRLKFSNEDVMSLAPETRFGVDSYTAQRESGEKASTFKMLKGKAMFYAMRLFRFKKTMFQVKTPTAVIGVRGTKFGVHVYQVEDERADRRGILVADSGPGIVIGPGQFFNSQTGVLGYDPSVLRLIADSVHMGGLSGGTGGPGGTGGSGGTGGTGGGGEGGGDGGGYSGTLNDLVADITSTQTGSGTEGGSAGGTTGAGEGGDTTHDVVRCGYFAVLLRDTGSTALEDVFLSKTPNSFTTGAASIRPPSARQAGRSTRTAPLISPAVSGP